MKFREIIYLLIVISVSALTIFAQGNFTPRDADEEHGWRLYNQYKASKKKEAELNSRITQLKRDIQNASLSSIGGLGADPSDVATKNKALEDLQTEQTKQEKLLAAWQKKFYWRYGDLKDSDKMTYDATTKQNMDKIQFALIYFPFNHLNTTQTINLTKTRTNKISGEIADDPEFVNSMFGRSLCAQTHTITITFKEITFEKTSNEWLHVRLRGESNAVAKDKSKKDEKEDWTRGSDCKPDPTGKFNCRITAGPASIMLIGILSGGNITGTWEMIQGAANGRGCFKGSGNFSGSIANSQDDTEPRQETPAPAKTNAADAQNLLKLGKEQRDKGNYSEALATLNRTLEIDSLNVEAFRLRGMTKRDLNDFAGAMNDYNLALEIEPLDPYLYSSRAVLKQRLSDFKGSLADFDLAIQFNPEVSFFYFARGNLRNDDLKDYAGAISDYDKCIELTAPEWRAKPLSKRAEAKMAINDKSGAIADFEKSLALNPDNESAKNNLARLKGKTSSVTEPSDLISIGVVNSKALNLAKPTYPPAAKGTGAEGTVYVEVIIDEEGNVISAKAVSGHNLLRNPAEDAARVSKFNPTLLSGRKVKVKGVIVYNFTAQ